jgi:hypothetical protein
VSDSLCVAIALSSSERDTFYINPYIFFYCKVILMSCSPADLTENITNSCDLKCKLVTDYPSQGITVTGISDVDSTGDGTGDSSALTINGLSNLNIEYNFSEYVVNDIRFVKKSYHRYGGKSVSAEMIIMHFGRGGGFILICIPIVVGFSSSDLDDVFSNAGKGNESSFDLNKFIPQQPYYSYKGGVGLAEQCPGNQAGEVIVFQKRHALTLLQKNIDDFIADSMGLVRFNISVGESISFSKNKPLKKEHDAAFPITCEPYEDTEMEEAKKAKSRPPFHKDNFKEWGSNVVLQIILGAAILCVLVKFLFFITNIGFKGGARRGSGFDSTMETM